ncbi:hypothetical protein JTB14_009359 [Gonioctena quinquepunctata]|nr:hypothetical protein JTB14_009359 [Gonioctena quinquepunctata]
MDHLEVKAETAKTEDITANLTDAIREADDILFPDSESEEENEEPTMEYLDPPLPTEPTPRRTKPWIATDQICPSIPKIDVLSRDCSCPNPDGTEERPPQPTMELPSPLPPMPLSRPGATCDLP